MGDTYHEAHMLVQAEIDAEREAIQRERGETTATVRGRTRYQTDNYRLDQYASPHSFVLVRKRDLASAYFQGDDAELWDRNMTAIEGIRQWNADNTLAKSFDYLCSGYDDILDRHAEETLRP